MEVQLQEIIEQIKKDGVLAAEAEASAIVEKAKKEAEKVVADAKDQAKKILEKAQKEAEQEKKSSEEAIRQAGRNMLLSFRESVVREVERITREQVKGVYASDEMAHLIANTVENMGKMPEAEDLTVVLNTEDLKKLEEAILGQLKDKLIQGVTLKASDSFDAGFRIAAASGSIYYDYSQEAVVEMISHYLSPRVVELMKDAENNG